MNERQQDPTPRWKVGAKLYTRILDYDGIAQLRACTITGYRVSAAGIVYSAKLSQPVTVRSSQYYHSKVEKHSCSGKEDKFFVLTEAGKLEFVANTQRKHERRKQEATDTYNSRIRLIELECQKEIATIVKELDGMGK